MGAHKTPFFGLRQTRLNGFISSSYPEVTLDTFGFPVGARSAARRAVFWPRLPKLTLFGTKICFFLRYAHITPFFGLKDTLVNGFISFSYPEVTLDTFGFPVGARSAARRTVFWPRLPKMALFVANNACRLQRS